MLRSSTQNELGRFGNGFAPNVVGIPPLFKISCVPSSIYNMGIFLPAGLQTTWNKCCPKELRKNKFGEIQ
jgi:hypothetical protein